MQSSPFAALDARLAPAPEPRRIAFFSYTSDFAHRGLWGPGAPENSLAAAAAAIREGHGIECDVRLSRDGTPHVIHDADARRLCGDPRRIDHMSDAEIAALRLSATEERVPTLASLLALIAGRAPLLIEIKTDTRAHVAICLAVRRAIEGYRGPVAVMGFNPEVSRWFGIHASRVPHGLVMSEYRDRPIRDAIRRRLAVWRARPDFLAYDVRYLASPLPTALHRKGLPLVTWTVRTEADRRRAARSDAIPTFERAPAR